VALRVEVGSQPGLDIQVVPQSQIDDDAQSAPDRRGELCLRLPLRQRWNLRRRAIDSVELGDKAEELVDLGSIEGVDADGVEELEHENELAVAPRNLCEESRYWQSRSLEEEVSVPLGGGGGLHEQIDGGGATLH
jgi:hypothetical protein